MLARALVLFLVVVSVVSAFPNTAHSAIFTVTSTNDAGLTSLRFAIELANANPGRDVIEFNIPGAGPHTIQPLSALPPIVDQVFIDGYSQPGASPNTNPATMGINATLMIEIDGSLAGEVNGIVLTGTAAGSRVSGLVINRFMTAVFDHSLPGGRAIVATRRDSIWGNFLGTDTLGTMQLGNGYGVECVSYNLIGGLLPESRNLISGNRVGIRIAGGAASPGGNDIVGNLIGTDVTGTLALGHVDQGYGIIVHNEGANLIGGQFRNVISGNDLDGILLESMTTGSGGTTISGNYIGADVNGLPLGNGGSGVRIDDFGAVFVGTGNLIAYNTGHGVSLEQAWDVVISANNILENGSSGVWAWESQPNNEVWQNTIASNGGNGVTVESNSSVLIQHNPIYNNAQPGIDLNADGITVNDLGDTDTGPNSLQNHPVVMWATTTRVSGLLNSTPNTDFTIEFFQNSQCLSPLVREGEIPLMTTDVTTDGGGNALFDVAWPTALPAGDFITATASSAGGETSEFSECIAIQADVGYVARPHEMPQPKLRQQAGLNLATYDFDTGPQGWTSVDRSGRGDFAALYPGVMVLQEDVCGYDLTGLWGFFDDPLIIPYLCHKPAPVPGQGSVPYVDAAGLYMTNEIWSPLIPNTGSGYDYRLGFSTYRDLELDGLLFYVWRVRSVTAGIAGPWRDRGMVYYGGHRDWMHDEHDIGDLIDPSADEIQIALGVWDMCGYWCGIYGTGVCHSHAPLFDEVDLGRINTLAPQFGVRHIDLFQDNFSGDGTLTGVARADAALDLMPPGVPVIQPGDSVAITISPVHGAIGDPSAWIYCRVQNSNAPKSGPALGSPDTRIDKVGPRYPYVGSWTDVDGSAWEIFQMDNAIRGGVGDSPIDRYCVDLNDAYFVPGDTILYFFAADVDDVPGNANQSYWHRKANGQGDDNVTGDIDEAAASPCEFTILPAGGFNRGGDILYVDDTDDRGGPAQIYFDMDFELLGIRHLVDRFDVLGPSSAAGNSLATRAVLPQIIIPYKKILWNSGNLSASTVGDGSGSPEKSDDYCLLYDFLDNDTDNPGLYLSGDDVAEEWLGYTSACAVALQNTYLRYVLKMDDHIAHGEPVSPELVSTGPPFEHLGVPDEMLAWGGCADINDFDVLVPYGSAVANFAYPISGDAAVVSQQTTNSVGELATVVLSGFSYQYISDPVFMIPPARVHFLEDLLWYLNNAVPSPTGIGPDGPPLADYLDENFPNPFNPETTIRYGVKRQTHVSLRVYNVAGQLVRTLVDEVKTPATEYKVTWNGDTNTGQPASTGVYFYKLVMKDFNQTKKMIYLK